MSDGPTGPGVGAGSHQRVRDAQNSCAGDGGLGPRRPPLTANASACGTYSDRDQPPRAASRFSSPLVVSRMPMKRSLVTLNIVRHCSTVPIRHRRAGTAWRFGHFASAVLGAPSEQVPPRPEHRDRFVDRPDPTITEPTDAIIRTG